MPQMLPPPHFMMPSPLAGPVVPAHATPFPPGLNVYSNAAYSEQGAAQQMQVQQQQLIALATAIIHHQSAMNPPPAGPDAAINRAVADWPQFSPPAPSRARTPRASGQSPGSHSKGKTRRQALRSLVRELDAVSAEASDMHMEEGEVQTMRHAGESAGHGEGSVDEDEDDAWQEARAAEGRLHAQRR